MKRRMKIYGSFLAAIMMIAAFWHFFPTPVRADSIGAASYDCSTDPWTVITVTTSATITVTLTDDDYTIQHLNIQNDGSTASVSTDYVVVMRSQDTAGTAVTMAATYADGVKLPIPAGAGATFTGRAVPRGVDGPRELQLKAVGHGAKMVVIRGRSPKE